MAKKLTRRKAFNFLRSYFDILNELEKDSEKLNFLLSIINKQFLDIDPEGLSFVENLCYESQRHQIESSVNGWKRVNKDTPITDPTTNPTTNRTTNPPTLPQQEEEEEKEEVPSKKQKVFLDLYLNQYEEIVLIFPEQYRPVKKSIKEKWLDTLRLLQEKDNLPFEAIMDITKWARSNDFWSKNFQSLVKLRQKNKQDAMYIQVFADAMKGEKKPLVVDYQAANREVLKNLAENE